MGRRRPAGPHPARSGRGRGPVLAAAIGDPSRFPSGAHFKSFAGLAPKASETGQTDRKGEPMSKAGPNLLRVTLVRAADTARKQDPQLARVYHQQMVERGANHLKATCVVAGHLAERAWAVLRRGMPYVICDTDGTPVTREEAERIIAQRWTVPPEVRDRRRSKKTGKAPHQAPTGHARPDTPRRQHTRRPSPPTILTIPATGVKQPAP
ncbi:hypothetical protein GCM10027053_36210 [Intrasporangium mesophilum]